MHLPLPPTTRALSSPPRSASSRLQGAIWGLLLGDALGVPTHFYEDPTLLKRDYGHLDGMERARHPHSESNLWRDPLPELPPAWDAFAGRRDTWARPGTHPHASLEAGDNSLDARLSLVLLDSIVSQGAPDGVDFLARLEAHLRPGGANRDLWMSPPLRHYLMQRAAGRPPGRFAESSGLTGGLVHVLPLALWHAGDSWNAQQAARRHLDQIHPGEVIPGALGFLSAVAGELLADSHLSLAQLVYEKLDRLSHGVLGFPYRRWMVKDDAEVLGGLLPRSHTVEDGLPGALYLALKYERSPRDGLLANTLAGGDTCGRGALLGFLLGLSGGLESLPEEWLTALEEFELHEDLIGTFAGRLNQAP